jgi:hypothetical protein
MSSHTLTVQEINAKLCSIIGNIANIPKEEGLKDLKDLKDLEKISMKAFHLAKRESLGYLDVPELFAELVFVLAATLIDKISNDDYLRKLSPARLFVFQKENSKLKPLFKSMTDPSYDLDITVPVSVSVLRSVIVMVKLFDPKVFSADLAVMTLEKIALLLTVVDVS